MKRIEKINGYTLVSEGYKQIIKLDRKPIHEFTDTTVGAIAFVKKLPKIRQ